ncbi:MAG: CCA tRNA nucleotidyltransferase [Halobacteriaceae archaeon]
MSDDGPDQSGTASLEAVLAAAGERVVPDDDERAALRDVVWDLRERAEAVVDGVDCEADVAHVGSTARGTWVSGDRDVDLFVRFPPALPEDRLEALGRVVGQAVLPDGREEYADHPYVTGEYRGYAVDVVPCYRVADPTSIQSPVDRTPFHDDYLRDRLDDDDRTAVRLAKGFLKGVGVYGSDLRTCGFSGYLTELLVLEYGGFEGFLTAAGGWQPPVRLDPAGHGDPDAFDDPLVVVDPTDPDRNVAAVVSETVLARCQHHARAFLDRPGIDYFERTDPDPLGREAVAAHLDRRGTTPLAVTFDPPDVVDDQLYPQLRRSVSGLTGGLEDAGFEVLRGDAFATPLVDGRRESAALFVELTVATLPAVERHVGPPVHVGGHAASFFECYDDGDSYGPFVDGDRYVVEREREVRTAAAFAEQRLFDVAHGTGVADSLRDGYEVLTDDEVTRLADLFGVELARYFDPTP